MINSASQAASATAEDLHAELMELAEAPFLRTLATKHRAGIIEALLRIATIEPGLDICAHDPGVPSGRRAISVSSLVMVGESVHLLFDDVRSFAARMLIKLGTLQQRDADFIESSSAQRPSVRVSSTNSPRARPADQILEASQPCQYSPKFHPTRR